MTETAATTTITSAIDTYLDAYSEADPTRRLALIEQVFAPEAHVFDPPIDGAGHTGIDEMFAAVQGQFAGHTFRRSTGVDAHHGIARYGWQLVAGDGSVTVAGTDVAVVDDSGKLTRVAGCFGDLPALERLLASHDPYPGVVLDRQWNIVLANDAALRLVGGLPAELLGPPTNVFRISLHPQGLAAITRNFAEWAEHMLTQLRRLVIASNDPILVATLAEVLAYPNVAALDRVEGFRFDEPALVVPCNLVVGGVELSLFTTAAALRAPP